MQRSVVGHCPLQPSMSALCLCDAQNAPKDATFGFLPEVTFPFYQAFEG